jgi:hypothetical protein
VALFDLPEMKWRKKKMDAAETHGLFEVLSFFT